MHGIDPRSMLESVRTLETELATVLARIEQLESRGLDLSSFSCAISSFYELQARLIRDVDTFLEGYDFGDKSHQIAAQALSTEATSILLGLARILEVLEPIQEVASLTLRLTCALHNWHTLSEDLNVVLRDPGAKKIETILLNLPVSPAKNDGPEDSIFLDIVQ